MPTIRIKAQVPDQKSLDLSWKAAPVRNVTLGEVGLVAHAAGGVLEGELADLAIRARSIATGWRLEPGAATTDAIVSCPSAMPATCASCTGR